MAAVAPGYQYHLLRGALERFSRNLADLDDRQLAEAQRQANKTYQLESLVLSSAEAGDVAIPQQQIELALAAVAARYPHDTAFEDDLAANGLDEASLRQALCRELVFDGVMQRVAARRPGVSPLDARLYYELHTDKFATPERRRARQILITINADYAENDRAAARARIESIGAVLRRSPNRFADQARRHSECPSAMNGGKLGEIRRGQLYPQLDAALFALAEGAVSETLETEMGFHLLWCEKVLPAKVVPFSLVEDRIKALLDERNRRNCQKAYLNRLRQQAKGVERQ